MLTIVISGDERWDELKEEFLYGDSYTITLEHSLISLSKWEAKWHKPFFSKDDMSDEQIIDYIKCMTLTQNVPDEVYTRLSSENFLEVTKYIEDSMTATWFSSKEEKGKLNNEQITAELIYYWMIALQIPFECQKWHLNRLLTLIRVCSIKNKAPEKTNKKEMIDKRRALNEQRRKAMKTKG